MAKSFSAQIDDFIAKSERLSMAVVQTATQEVIKESQEPRAKGGRMPVRDGFLINSGVAALNKIPSGTMPTTGSQTWTGEGAMAAVLLRAKPGDLLYYGWVAQYAPYMEARYAFMGMAVQNWQQQVDKAVRQIRQRAGR